MAEVPAPGPGAAPAIAEVAVAVPMRRTFDYLIAEGLRGRLVAGMRVAVPFGRGRRFGVVLSLRDTSEIDTRRLKPITSLLEEQPSLDDAQLALLRFAVRYHHGAPGDAVAAMLPAPLRRLEPVSAPRPEWLCLTAEGVELDPDDIRRAPRRRALLELLRARPEGLLRSELPGGAGPWRAALRWFLEARLVRLERAPELADPGPLATANDGASTSTRPENAPELRVEQSAAVDAVASRLGGFACFLLDGVTGSGKTEVYLELSRLVLERGRQVLVLIPEIGLTPQTLGRFRDRLGGCLVVWHSALSDGERLDAWRTTRRGQPCVVLGTRSAVFAPLPELGLLVVDEEHDASFKQQEGLRYSARDLAVYKAHQLDVPIVLGSATPSLESLHNVEQGRYERVVLRERAGHGASPRFQIVDIRSQRLQGGLSATALVALRECVERDEQAMLFVNRRGYAPILMCAECGAPVDCTRCDAHLVYHKPLERLVCHHCGSGRAVPEACGACGAEYVPIGAGTQRVVEGLVEVLPELRVDRFDRDSTRRKGRFDEVLARFRSGATQVLVGTQMLTKGHDFPGVTLVVIIDADGSLFSVDFRAPERMAQQILQVAGRAGRGAKAGQVLIQTRHPQHPTLNALCEPRVDPYGRIAIGLLAERRDAGLPPYASLALLRAEAPDGPAAERFLCQARDAAAPDQGTGVTVLGPVPAPMLRRGGRYRYQLMLEARTRAALQDFLRSWVPALESLPGAARVRWSLDVDPNDMG